MKSIKEHHINMWLRKNGKTFYHLEDLILGPNEKGTMSGMIKIKTSISTRNVEYDLILEGRDRDVVITKCMLEVSYPYGGTKAYSFKIDVRNSESYKHPPGTVMKDVKWNNEVLARSILREEKAE